MSSFNNAPCSLLLVLGLGAACILAASVQKRGVVYQPAGVLVAAVRPRDHEQPQDLSKVPGVAGVDYPIYHEVPPTSFHCGSVPALPGMYANVETGCQAYHICHDGREGEQGASFLCTNGTLFNQAEFNCDWWYNVNCAEATSLYSLNLDPLKNPFAPKPKLVEGLPVAVVAHK